MWMRRNLKNFRTQQCQQRLYCQTCLAL
uniref:Uncharacterized protein n=1 Tax=Rhizophora mucronata TaxID=61149 RepID=A0A2P2P7A2_RHIMU